jgi:hypothetical protein
MGKLSAQGFVQRGEQVSPERKNLPMLLEPQQHLITITGAKVKTMKRGQGSQLENMAASPML